MIKKTWNDISLGDYLKLKKIKDGDDSDVILQILSIVYDMDANDIPIAQYNDYVDSLDFIKTEIPKRKLCSKYDINGRKYEFNINVIGMSTAQFFDFQHYAKDVNNEDNIAKILSVFLVPVGHKYNDGYDVRQAQEDMLSIPIPDVITMSNFFFQLSKRLQVILKTFLKHQYRKTKKTMTEEEKTAMEKVIKMLDMAYSHTY